MDFLKDNSKRTWIKIANRVTVPSYVNKAEVLTTKKAAVLDDMEFADIVKRQFPIDTPANTWTSSVYFNFNKDTLKQAMDADEFKYVQDRIKEASILHSVTSDVNKAEEELTIPYREPSDKDYGLLVFNKKGEVISRKYLMMDEQGVKKASSFFDTYRFKYPYETRKTIASSIIIKAAEYNVNVESLPQSVQCDAGVGLPDIAFVKDEISKRAELCEDKDVATVISNINTLVDNVSGEALLTNLDKIAEVITEFDRLTELEKYYGNGILPPSDFLYSMSIKTASETVDFSIKLCDYIFDLRKLAELPKDVFSILGDEFVKKAGACKVEELRSAIEELSVTDKIILEDYLKGL